MIEGKTTQKAPNNAEDVGRSAFTAAGTNSSSGVGAFMSIAS